MCVCLLVCLFIYFLYCASRNSSSRDVIFGVPEQVDVASMSGQRITFLYPLEQYVILS